MANRICLSGKASRRALHRIGFDGGTVSKGSPAGQARLERAGSVGPEAEYLRECPADGVWLSRVVLSAFALRRFEKNKSRRRLHDLPLIAGGTQNGKREVELLSDAYHDELA